MAALARMGCWAGKTHQVPKARPSYPPISLRLKKDWFGGVTQDPGTGRGSLGSSDSFELRCELRGLEMDPIGKAAALEVL